MQFIRPLSKLVDREVIFRQRSNTSPDDSNSLFEGRRTTCNSKSTHEMQFPKIPIFQMICAMLLLGFICKPVPVSAQNASPSAPLAQLFSNSNNTQKEDIRDIRGPRWSPWWWVPIPFAFLVFVAICWAGYMLWAGRSKPKYTAQAHELALQKIEEAHTLMDPSRAKAFSILVSDALRFYLEKRFQIQATHQTTEEFLRRVSSSDTPELRSNIHLLQSFLDHCDFAKFAQGPLSREQMEQMYSVAKSFVVNSSSPAHVTPPPLPS